MRKNLFTGITVCLVFLSVVFAGCGSTVKEERAPGTLQGVAATGAPVHGTVTLTDASSSPKVRTTATGADGSFAFTLGGLTAPFILKAQWTDSTGTNQLYAFAEGAGTTNINPFTDVAFVAAVGATDSSSVSTSPDAEMFRAASRNKRTIMQQLMNKLEPLFALYGTDSDPDSDHYDANHTGLDALLDDIVITIKNRTVTVTDRRTSKTIFTAPVSDIDSGTFYPENMPGQPGQVDGAKLYADNCSSCHGSLASSEVKGKSASDIQEAIEKDTGGMGSLDSLTALQIQAIAAALAGGSTTTPPPPTTTDGATLYADYCASCHGALASSSKRGATASAITAAINNNTGRMGSLSNLTASQISAIAAALAGGTTTPPPPPPTTTDGATLYADYCASCHGALASSSKKGTTASAITAAINNNTGRMGSLSNLTSTQISAIAAVLAGSTTPPPPATCTYTYSVWGSCQSSNTQTRTLLSSSPAGCTGTPVLTQSCTYVAPPPAACTYTYSAWGTCQSNNTQTRTVLTTSPNGCTGTPALTQSCTYVAPIDGAALYTQYCYGCHRNNKKGSSASAIQNAINSDRGGMGTTALKALTPAQIAAISAAP